MEKEARCGAADMGWCVDVVAEDGVLDVVEVDAELM